MVDDTIVPTTLGHVGDRLLSHQYELLPVVAGRKNPRSKKWVETVHDVHTLAAFVDDSVGVKCGQGAVPLVAVDIDSRDDQLSAQFAQWCRERFGYSIERIGLAPKTLLVYRAAEPGWTKVSSRRFVDHMGETHQLELLGHGQQFVAYGVHPDTNMPYEWVDAFGGPVGVPASALPVLTHEQLAQAVEAFEVMALTAGYEPAAAKTHANDASNALVPVTDTPLSAFVPPVDKTPEQCAEMLTYLNPDMPYDDWFRVGAALHHQFDGDDEGFEMWDLWSSQGTKYPGDEKLRKHWESFHTARRNGTRPTTMATVIAMIKKVGATNEQAHATQSDELTIRLTNLIDNCEDTSFADFMKNTVALAAMLAATRQDLKALAYEKLQRKYKTLFADQDDTKPAYIEPNVLRRALRLAETRPTSDAVERTHAAVHIPNHEYTEFGLTSRFIALWADQYMYTPGLGWYQFDQSCGSWRAISDGHIMQQVKMQIYALRTEHEGLGAAQAAALEAFIKRCQTWDMMQRIVKLLSIEPSIYVPPEALDMHRWYLGALNGVINLNDGSLIPCTPDNWREMAHWRITMRVAVNYDPNAVCPMFERTVSEAFYGDRTLIEYWQRLMGYSLTGDPAVERIMVIPYGASGSNGKSTILGAINDTLAEYAGTASPETFVSGRQASPMSGASPREDLLRLFKKRFLLVNEIDEGSQLREGLIKTITGGDKLIARGVLEKKSVEFRATWLTIMATNYKPVVRSNGSPIWNRLKLVPFERNFKTDPLVHVDPNRPALLKIEQAGILAWLVRGAIAYQGIGLAEPHRIAHETQVYRSEMDTLGAWFRERLVMDPDAWTSTQALFDSWRGWAMPSGIDHHATDAAVLYRKLQGREGLFSEERRLRKGFRGVRVRAEADPMPDGSENVSHQVPGAHLV